MESLDQSESAFEATDSLWRRTKDMCAKERQHLNEMLSALREGHEKKGKNSRSCKGNSTSDDIRFKTRKRLTRTPRRKMNYTTKQDRNMELIRPRKRLKREAILQSTVPFKVRRMLRKEMAVQDLNSELPGLLAYPDSGSLSRGIEVDMKRLAILIGYLLSPPTHQNGHFTEKLFLNSSCRFQVRHQEAEVQTEPLFTYPSNHHCCGFGVKGLGYRDAEVQTESLCTNPLPRVDVSNAVSLSDNDFPALCEGQLSSAWCLASNIFSYLKSFSIKGSRYCQQRGSIDSNMLFTSDRSGLNLNIGDSHLHNKGRSDLKQASEIQSEEATTKATLTLSSEHECSNKSPRECHSVSSNCDLVSSFVERGTKEHIISDKSSYCSDKQEPKEDLEGVQEAKLELESDPPFENYVNTEEFLLLMRQQELLHLTSCGEMCSAPPEKLISQRLGKTHLPPELQNYKVVTPKVTQKGHSVVNSAEADNETSARGPSVLFAVTEEDTERHHPPSKRLKVFKRERKFSNDDVVLKYSPDDQIAKPTVNEENCGCGKRESTSYECRSKPSPNGSDIASMEKSSKDEPIKITLEGSTCPQVKTFSGNTDEAINSKERLPYSESNIIFEKVMKAARGCDGKGGQKLEINMQPPSSDSDWNMPKKQLKSSEQAGWAEKPSIGILEMAKAHDLVVHVMLNPWRGLNAKCTTKSFNFTGDYEKKLVIKSLWDLRCNAPIDTVKNKILAIKFENFNAEALNIMVEMFLSALSRQAPFVIEACESGKGLESTASSDSGELDKKADKEKKRQTRLQLVASRKIFKGEVINALEGKILQATKDERGMLKSWNFPPSKLGGIYGPLAFICWESNSLTPNSEVIVHGDHCQVKARRHIYVGEKIIATLKIKNFHK